MRRQPEPQPDVLRRLLRRGHALAPRPMLHVQLLRGRLRARRGHGGHRHQDEAVGQGGRRVRPDRGQPGEPGRPQRVAHGAQRARAGAVRPHRAEGGESPAARAGHHRVPRHRHLARRPHRDRRLPQGDGAVGARGAGRHHGAQVEHGPLRGQRRHLGLPQVRPPLRLQRRHPERPPQHAEPALGHGRLPGHHHLRGRPLPRRVLVQQRALLRLRRHQRLRRPVRTQRLHLSLLGAAGHVRHGAPQDAGRTSAGGHHHRRRLGGLGRRLPGARRQRVRPVGHPHRPGRRRELLEAGQGLDRPGLELLRRRHAQRLGQGAALRG
mmetsp:Transcript_76141/g.196163  ORF Transcript_76141/g.196163 Transcript_76141/m.196163 type:complete len:323 (-) Transcript_76141:300-1268(-)